MSRSDRPIPSHGVTNGPAAPRGPLPQGSPSADAPSEGQAVHSPADIRPPDPSDRCLPGGLTPALPAQRTESGDDDPSTSDPGGITNMIAPNTNGTAAPVEPSIANAIGTPTRPKKKARRPAGSSAESAQSTVLPTLAHDSDKSIDWARVEELLVRFFIFNFLSKLDTAPPLINGKLVLNEREAAAVLGLNPWQLRDLRKSGKISHHRIVRNQVRYTLDDLLEYLGCHRRRATV